MAAKAQKLVSLVSSKIPVVVEASKPKLRTFIRYAKVELIPPSPTEIPQIIQGFRNLVKSGITMKWTKLSVGEAWLNSLIATEVICWFFIGEVIGRRHLIGYDV